MMMRTSATIMTVGVSTAIAFPAAAGDVQIVGLGDWVVPVHEIGIVFGPSIDFEVDLEVIAFTFDVDFVNNFLDSSWVSDLEMMVTNPAGETFVVGQEAFNGGDPFGPQDDIWDFDGPDGTPSGHYESSHTFGGAAGLWNVQFAESWDGGVEYNNMTLTLEQVPGPGALALLGLAGLTLRRRRRER